MPVPPHPAVCPQMGPSAPAHPAAPARMLRMALPSTRPAARARPTAPMPPAAAASARPTVVDPPRPARPPGHLLAALHNPPLRRPHRKPSRARIRSSALPFCVLPRRQCRSPVRGLTRCAPPTRPRVRWHPPQFATARRPVGILGSVLVMTRNPVAVQHDRSIGISNDTIDIRIGRVYDPSGRPSERHGPAGIPDPPRRRDRRAGTRRPSSAPGVARLGPALGLGPQQAVHADPARGRGGPIDARGNANLRDTQ